MYAPIVWMFCMKTLYLKIQKIFERGAKILNSIPPETEDVLIRNPTTIHELHLRQLLSEVFKSQNLGNPAFMSWLFPSRKTKHYLRSKNLLSVRKKVLTVRHGFNSFPFRASILWNKLSDKLKNSKDFSTFKSSIIKVKLLDLCTCNICKTY